MSQLNLSQLRQQLERWKSHNEVNAKPADGILYEFFSSLLKSLEGDEPEQPVNEPKDEIVDNTPEGPSTTNDGEGGNSPSEPPVLP